MSLELRAVNDGSRNSPTAPAWTFETQPLRASQITHHRLALVVVFVLCLTMLTTFHFPDFVRLYGNSEGRIVAKEADLATVPLQPTSELILGVHHYFMLPKSSFPKPRGLLVVLHACKQSGLEFFHLPEDRIVAQHALQKGLAVLSLTSQDRVSGCFTQQDVSWVGKVVNEWTKLHSLRNLPRFGLASSSGASFLFFVFQELKLESMVVYNTPQSFLPDDVEEKVMIPTVFVTMPADKNMAKRMRKNHDDLVRQQIPTLLLRVAPRPFAKPICDARFPEMLAHDCYQIFDVLQQNHSTLLDKDGFVTKDWNSGQWQSLFETLGVDSRTDDLYFQTPTAFSGHSWTWAALEQEVQTCHAYHAMTAEHHANILDFLITSHDSKT